MTYSLLFLLPLGLVVVLNGVGLTVTAALALRYPSRYPAAYAWLVIGKTLLWRRLGIPQRGLAATEALRLREVGKELPQRSRTEK